MDYGQWITIPITATKASPQKTRVKLPKGRVVQVLVYIPKGHMGLTYIRIMHGVHQLWPQPTDEYYRGDGIPFVIPDNRKITQFPYRVTIETANVDTLHSHDVFVSIIVLEEVEETEKGIMKRMGDWMSNLGF